MIEAKIDRNNFDLSLNGETHILIAEIVTLIFGVMKNFGTDSRMACEKILTGRLVWDSIWREIDLEDKLNETN